VEKKNEMDIAVAAAIM